jgi:hypothetical protein
MCNCHNFLHSDSPVGTFFLLTIAAVRRKERKVEDARQHLIEAGKELAVEELPKRDYPATKKRGADPHIPSKIKRKRLSNPKEQKLETGREHGWVRSSKRYPTGYALCGKAGEQCRAARRRSPN